MSPSLFLERLQNGEVLVSDGATGTNLQARGLTPGAPAEIWVLEQPEQIVQLHRDFITAGANIILTCTFGGTTLRLEQANLADRAEELNQRAVELARQAVAGADVLVGGSMGPCGQLLKPLGPLEETDVSAAYSQQACTLTQAGVDLLVIETQFDLGEAKLAVQAARQVSSLPIVCSFSYDRGVRTMMGVRPTQMAQELSALDVNVLGINCGRSLEENLKALQELRSATELPLWFKPNAGLPQLDSEGRPVYELTPEAMGEQVPLWLAAGARVVGGCCGTSPEHLQCIAQHARL